MSKATHKGICQSCGRLHKLPGGNLSKHGYTVDFGYFFGTCGGSHAKPLELERSILDATVAGLRAHADRLDASEPKTITCNVAVRHEYRGRKRVQVAGNVKNTLEAFTALALEHEQDFVMHGWLGADAVAERYQAAVEHAKSGLRRQARMARDHADYLVELAGKVHGRELTAV